jgi:DNA-binding response OmpR family regulator
MSLNGLAPFPTSDSSSTARTTSSTSVSKADSPLGRPVIGRIRNRHAFKRAMPERRLQTLDEFQASYSRVLQSREAGLLMRLLVVEDDVAIQGFLKRALSEAGYQVDTASDGKTGELRALEGIHDAFIIDLGLPDMDGLDLIARCRAQGGMAPVLILSARRSVDERVRGLERGGDDYLTKPFALAELLARLRNLLRRSAALQNDSVRLQVADLQLDLLRHEARRGENVLPLTPQEFSLLEYLCRNSGRVVTRTMILDHVWRMRIDPATNVVDVHIYRLRNKVDQNGLTPLIHTIRGVGYVVKHV